MSVSIFIKSWRSDLKWLHYCLRFLEKNWAEPRTEVVVLLDEDCRGEVEGWKLGDFDPSRAPLRYVISYVEPWPDGYAHAMYCKACADKYCLSDAILLLDSDCMLLQPADASVFFDELPVIPWISYDEHHKLYPHSPWQKVTEKVLKIRSERHYMPVMPILYWAKTLHDMRRHIVELHGAISFKDVVYSKEPFDPANFSEHPHTFIDYDCLGLYAERFEAEHYVFRHQSELAPNPFKQFHSWSEWNDATPGILDQCLAEAASV